MSPHAVECKMYIYYACKKHVDEESICDRAVKKFYEMKKRRKENCRVTLECDLICMSHNVWFNITTYNINIKTK